EFLKNTFRHLERVNGTPSVAHRALSTAGCALHTCLNTHGLAMIAFAKGSRDDISFAIDQQVFRPAIPSQTYHLTRCINRQTDCQRDLGQSTTSPIWLKY
ncbi:MAG TPA: hypothetical protein VM260_26965, partial [Pirellula sp.]|nr:hypothetical protein [Pirellula sp.]